MPLGDNEAALILLAAGFENGREIVEIIVLEETAMRPRQFRADDDRIMRQLIVQDQVFGANECRNRRNIRRVAADEEEAILAVVDLGEFRFKRDGTAARPP